MIEEIDTDLLEDFEKSGQIPMLWQWRARECICAANILRATCEKSDLFASDSKDPDRMWKPYNAIRLLYGLALENLLKALLVARGTPATLNGKLNQEIHSHDLVYLWKKAGLELTAQTEKVLKGLHWSVESGKYPIGTKPDDANARLRAVVNTINVNGIIKLIEKVEDALREEQPLRAIDKTDLAQLCYE